MSCGSSSIEVAPQDAADPGDAAVGLRRLADLRAVLGDAHGAEFVDGDLPAIQSVAALLEDHGSGRGRP